MKNLNTKITYVLILLLIVVLVGNIKINQIVNVLDSTYGKLALILLLIVSSTYDLQKTAIGIIVLFALYITAKYTNVTEAFENNDEKEVKLTDKDHIGDYVEIDDTFNDEKHDIKTEKKEKYENVKVDKDKKNTDDVEECLKKVYSKYPNEFARLIQNMESQRKIFNERTKGKEKDEDHMAYETQQFRAYLKLMLEQALNNLDDEDDAL